MSLESQIGELVSAIRALSAQLGQSTTLARPAEAPVEMPVAAPAPAPAAPAPAPAAPAPAPAAPAADAPQLTIDEVRQKMQGVVQAGRMAEVQKALADLGVEKLSDLKPEQYGALLAAVGV